MKNPAINIPKEIFRAYDIRGVVDHSLTVEMLYLIGQAIGTSILQQAEHQIVIGRDGRLSGPRLNEALKAGLMATGIEVVDIGQVPTPLLYFATKNLDISSGVMLTGSHNPSHYNGLKILINGSALFGEGIQKLYHLIEQGDFYSGSGSCVSADIEEDYLTAIRSNIKLSSPLKVVVDAGNGVVGSIGPRVYKQLGCEVIPLFCEIDGHFPNHHPDPGQPKNLEALRQAVCQHQADLGLAFDGDGDRLGLVDNLGNIIWPDRQLILFARDLLSRHPSAQILFDVKCTRDLSVDIAKQGGRPLMCQTGHSLIKAKMKETGALLAGEMSGHFFFQERWYGFDDALYAGARLLEIVSKNHPQQSVAQLFSTLPNSVNTPEILFPIAESEKMNCVARLIQAAHFETGCISTIDGLRVDFEDGFGLIRPSNTGPNLVMRFEGRTAEALQRIQDQFRELFKILEPDWKLPF